MTMQNVAFNSKEQSSVPLATLGSVHIDELGRRWLYGRANGTLTAGRMHHMTTATSGMYDFTPNTTTLTGTPGTNWKYLGVPDIDMTDDYYGWFWIGYGPFECVIEHNFAAADIVYTTANAGLPGTNSSSFILDGFKSIDAGVTATRVSCWAARRLTAGITNAGD